MSDTVMYNGNRRFLVPEPTNRLFVEVTAERVDALLAAASVEAETDSETEESEDRIQRLSELARWSVTTADLDWEHADRIGEHAWGQH